MGQLLKTPLQQRAASACIMIPAVLAIIYYGGTLFFVSLAILALLSFYEWFYAARKTQQKYLYSFIGALYIAAGIWSCYVVRTEFLVHFAFIFVLMVWSSDIGAYFVGKTLKGPKMAKAISPNKTWAGYVGALTFPGLVTFLLLSLYSLVSGDSFDVDFMALLFAGGVIGLVGQSGDLLVSFLKRRAKVKDMGRLIPGHGGVLDRIDSLLLAAPVYLFIITKFSHAIGS